MQPGQHRETARVILCKPNSEIFLLKTHFDPEVGLPPRWITPGGGIDEGESVIQAAVRELAEETGLEVSPEALGELIWVTEGRWDWADGQNYHTFVDHFYLLQIQDFALDISGWTADEHRDVVEHRWWSLDDLKQSGESLSPPGLVDFLTSHLHG
jgi:8-oxo-dGTP pyrophosphatase MutT (NUDIX family)